MPHLSSSLATVRALAIAAIIAALAACGGSDKGVGPNTGSIKVTVASSGVDIDPVGYTVSVDGGSSQAIGPNASITIDNVAVGTHAVALGGLASNCTVGTSPASVTVSVGATANAAFTVTCVARRIVFESNRDGNFEIYQQNDDGSGLVRLTNDTSFDGLPSWTPDGSQFAFSSSRDRSGPGLDIWRMNADGSGLQRLTSAAGENGRAVYSPDGTKIVFTSTRDDPTPGHAEIYVMSADGTGQTRLTTDHALANIPSWSPDGSKIVFQSNRSGTDQLWVINADGSALTRLTSDAANDGAPAWSPDGSKILFQSDRDRTGSDATTVEVYVMNANGTGQTRLTNDVGAFDGSPSWSSDGRKVLFDSNRDGNFELFVMSLDGSGQTNVTHNAADDGFGRFKP